ncbi:type II toxin-antitoxin system RelE/ParE family toxin [Methylobacterium sp. SI9]|uniref:type II toxin-antitoxin system RelE/ParE family toxin n=1 Tax=Methylobacterium guangdongense TaxID=3138811 RepID=UPI00313B8BFB
MWSVVTLNDTVDAELEALPVDMRARFDRICELIEAVGLSRVGEPHVKQLDGKIWEMRMSGKAGISRAIYIAQAGRRVVILRVFIKKTQKTPPAEIKLARERAKTLATGTAKPITIGRSTVTEDIADERGTKSREPERAPADRSLEAGSGVQGRLRRPRR